MGVEVKFSSLIIRTVGKELQKGMKTPDNVNQKRIGKRYLYRLFFSMNLIGTDLE